MRKGHDSRDGVNSACIAARSDRSSPTGKHAPGFGRAHIPTAGRRAAQRGRTGPAGLRAQERREERAQLLGVLLGHVMPGIDDGALRRKRAPVLPDVGRITVQLPHVVVA